MNNPISNYELGKTLHREYEAEAGRQEQTNYRPRPVAKDSHGSPKLNKRLVWLVGDLLIIAGTKLKAYPRDSLHVKQVCYK